jgi:hypothetical protein
MGRGTAEGGGGAARSRGNRLTTQTDVNQE